MQLITPYAGKHWYHFLNWCSHYFLSSVWLVTVEVPLFQSWTFSLFYLYFFLLLSASLMALNLCGGDSHLSLLVSRLAYPTVHLHLCVGDLCLSSMSKSCHVQNELLIFLLEAFS